MREGIHPKYVETTITCACGNVINTTNFCEAKERNVFRSFFHPEKR